MQFGRTKPTLRHTEDSGNDHMCFAADLFPKRPPFDEMNAYQDWATQLEEHILKNLDRTRCSVKWIGIFVDTEGALLIATHKSGQSLNNMRQSLKTALSWLPVAERKTLDTLRPLDELDKVRISAWLTIDDLGPDPEDESSAVVVPSQALALPPDAEEAIKVLCQMGPEDQTKLAWRFRAMAYAVIVVASTGPLPELTYVHCRSEQRRHMLLTGRLNARTKLVDTVKIAAKLAEEDSIPSPGGRRTSEFMKRCANATKAVNPDAEIDVHKLSAEDQKAVRQALGGKEPYDGCLSPECLDKDTVWKAERLCIDFQGRDLQVSRCTRCNMPKAWGRTLHSPFSFIERRDYLERGMRLRRSLLNFPVGDFRIKRRRIE